MLTLCGFAASNYYNKVKLALLEKGAAFVEEQAFPSGDEDRLRLTPMGKVPFLRVAGGGLSESQAIVEYLEETCPEPPLYPKDVLARAKCRELIQMIELYLEWPARRLYLQAYFGGTVSEETKAEVQRALARAAKALPRLTGFETFAFGDRFTYADCAAAMHLPLAYLRRMAERPCVQRVNEDRKAGLEAFAAYRAAKAQAAAAATGRG
jgi:glutathione S-transferase